MKHHGAAAVLLACLTVFSSSLSFAAAANDFNLSLKDTGLLVNFSVPCDLDSRIAVPDQGGLLTPNLLAIGYQEYKYDGSKWVFNVQSANLYNKTLAKVGTLAGGMDTKVTFGIFANQKELGTVDAASVTAKPIKSVLQRFAIPIQLLNVTGVVKTSNYYASDYIQRFGTQTGLAPGSTYPAKKNEIFRSRFTAFYAFFLPSALSPQLATRVPRCGDERFYGLQFGRDF
ncbi:hypothetical protein Mapa_005324 [Marchantia paleacea]|nr:hypothetical protein Mapa_005324 [Marchantia paleacea]